MLVLFCTVTPWFTSKNTVSMNPFTHNSKYITFSQISLRATILDKTCWHNMLKKGNFPQNTLNKSPTYSEIKCQLHPFPQNNVARNVFHLIFNRQFRGQQTLHVTLNQHCSGERGFVSTVLSKIVGFWKCRPAVKMHVWSEKCILPPKLKNYGLFFPTKLTICSFRLPGHQENSADLNNGSCSSILGWFGRIRSVAWWVFCSLCLYYSTVIMAVSFCARRCLLGCGGTVFLAACFAGCCITVCRSCTCACSARVGLGGDSLCLGSLLIFIAVQIVQAQP